MEILGTHTSSFFPGGLLELIMFGTMLCKLIVLCKCDLLYVLPSKHSFSQPVAIEGPFLRSDKPLFEAGAYFVHVGVYV